MIDGTWTPNADIIADIEPLLTSVLQPLLDAHNATLRELHVSLPLLNATDFFVQCVGVIRGNRRLVYLNGFHRWFVDYSGDEKWRTVPWIAHDGAQSFFGAEYDPEIRRIIAVVFNGPYSSRNPPEGWTELR
jgi:hypothetical protein